MMVRLKKQLWIILAGLTIAVSCRESFEIEYEVVDTAPILVVEGYMNASDTESHYKLRYARSMGDGTRMEAIAPDAAITIESEAGAKYYSQRTGDEDFVISHPLLDPTQRYRLSITIGDARYESDFVEVRISPEISSLDWAQTADGVEIYVSTEDPTAHTRYYRYEYEEDWRYFSRYISTIILDGDVVRDRLPSEFFHTCYISDTSSVILLTTSRDLTRDAIHRFPVKLIPNLSDRLSSRYSILVKQIPLTEASYTYWEQLRESSEELGDIFGPMPSELKGNIICVSHPERHVIGLAEVASIAEKRLFISREETPDHWFVVDEFYSDCHLLDSAALEAVRNDPWYLLVEPVRPDPDRPDFISDYYYADRRCLDCRFKGGQFEAPDFWKERDAE